MRSWKDYKFSDYILNKTSAHDEQFKKNNEYYQFGKKDFADNVNDLHHVFYSKIQKPEEDQDAFFVGFIGIMDETNEFLELKDKCSGNAALAFIATREMTGKMYEEYIKMCEETKNKEGEEKQDAINQFLKKNKDRIRQEMKASLKQAKEKVEEGEAIDAFISCGDEDSVNDKLNHAEKVLKMAKKLSRNRWFAEIVKLAGNFTRSANKKLTRDIPDVGSPVGVDIGNDLSRVLPQEFAMMELGNGFEDLFWLKWTNSELMQHKTTMKESLEEGAFIVCIDESGSMGSDIAKAKAFLFGMYLIAKAKNREMYVVRFDTKAVGTHITKLDDMLEIVDKFLGGGTDFDAPLSHSIDLIENNPKWNKADIFFVTDGESQVSPELLEKMKEIKNRIQFKVLSLALSRQTKELKKFSDVVFMAKDSEKFYSECFDQ